MIVDARLTWAVSGDTMAVQARDPFEEEDVIQRLAARARREVPVEQRYPGTRNQSQRYDTTRYYASDRWRPT